MTMLDEYPAYTAFLREKIGFAASTGFPCEISEINSILFPHQKAIVQWCVEGGRRAIFASFGLGKSVCQLEICRLILQKDYEARAGYVLSSVPQGRALIVCPLGVRQEFTRDAKMLGIPVRFVRWSHEVDEPGVYLTNYESVRDGRLDVNLFDVASLDEASVLRSYGSLTYQSFLTLFQSVRFRFVATATPSPNRFKELIHYAGFLGIMDTGQALTRYFQRDSTKANNLTLHPQHEKEFWYWLNSWSIFLQTPSDLGFSDLGYDLPPLNIVMHELGASCDFGKTETNGQSTMMLDAAVGLRDAAAEKRGSMDSRIQKMLDIVNAAPPDTHFIIWHTLEDERHAIKAALPEAVSVYGSQDLDEREKAVIDFSEGRIRVLSGKPSVMGSGCNFQRHCCTAIFLGVDYKANDLMQAVHRIQRFQQPKPCTVHIIHTETEREIVKTLMSKWENHKKMTETMTDIIREHGLNSLSLKDVLQRTIGVERIEVSGKHYTLANNDCVLEARRQADNSVDLIVTSIPFCYDEQTEILTKRGWVSFGDLTAADELGTVNPNLLCFEWQTPSRIIWQQYEGEMLRFGNRCFDLLVTPNHNMFAARRGRSFSASHLRLVKASDILADYERCERKTQGDGRILRGWRTCLIPPSQGGGNCPERINIPPLPPDIKSGHGVQLYWIEAEDFMELAGWYLSEGHADSFESSRQGGRISIAQSKSEAKRQQIVDLFLRIGLPPSMHSLQMSVWCRNLAYFLQSEFGHGAKQKRIPRWVLELHPNLLCILRDTMMKGDGATDGTSYASYSSQLRDDFQEICLKTGWRATIKGNIVKVGNDQIYPEIRRAPERVQYKGMIGCATVPNGLLIVRRNGMPCISGNSNHYEYTACYEDMGHTDNNAHFWAQMDFLTPELLRILNPGRLYCCHVKDRILFGNVTGEGVPTVSPFHAEALMHGLKHGFQYLGMITVVTDVVRENNQTYRLGWTENSKDGTKMGVGSPEYILLFRKPQSDKSKGYADIPVTKSKQDYTRARWQTDAHAFWRSSGNRLLTAEDMANYGPAKLAKMFTDYSLQNIYDHEFHVKIGEELDMRGALPSSFMSLAPGSHHPDVWHDVNRMLTLNGAQASKGKELHICPLQTDIINRLIDRYSMPGELVYDPFMGLGSTAYCAVKKGRRGAGSELNTSYFMDSLCYLGAAEAEVSMPSLFSLEELAEVQEEETVAA